MSIDGSWLRLATICIYDLHTATIRRRFTSASGHVKFVISPDGRWLAGGGSEPIVEIWDLTSGKLVDEFAGRQKRIFCLAFSPDSQMLASGGDDGTVIVWNVAGSPQP